MIVIYFNKFVVSNQDNLAEWSVDITANKATAFGLKDTADIQSKKRKKNIIVENNVAWLNIIVLIFCALRPRKSRYNTLIWNMIMTRVITWVKL